MRPSLMPPPLASQSHEDDFVAGAAFTPGFVKFITDLYADFIDDTKDEFEQHIGEPFYVTYEVEGEKTTVTMKNREKLENIFDIKYNMSSTTKFAWLVDEKYIEMYADIRYLEKGMPVSKEHLKKIKTEARQIYAHGKQLIKNSRTNSLPIDKFNYLAELAIGMIEFGLGTVASLDKDKELTEKSNNAILLSKVI